MQIDLSEVPESVLGGLQRYVEYGVPTGDFLRAVLSNDLKESFARANDVNREAMFDIVRFCYDGLPSLCWGSTEKVEDWINMAQEERFEFVMSSTWYRADELREQVAAKQEELAQQERKEGRTELWCRRTIGGDMTTATKERPIIFTGEMVRAILDGSKTQTRLVVKPQPCRNSVGQWLWEKRPGLQIPFHPELDEQYYPRTKLQNCCPYGRAKYREWAGDLLWVRETWADHDKAGVKTNAERYRADLLPGGEVDDRFKWRPSIFMPRLASRILLEITNVRVELVQDISHADALAESMREDAEPNNYGAGGRARDAFAKLWDSINAKRGFGWESDPWVWVIEFKKLQTSERSEKT